MSAIKFEEKNIQKKVEKFKKKKKKIKCLDFIHLEK
jgi:hypothetical protein